MFKTYLIFISFIKTETDVSIYIFSPYMNIYYFLERGRKTKWRKDSETEKQINKGRRNNSKKEDGKI
jgi:hypothetical protein